MGILDIILGRDQNGNVSKVNLALIALMLWRMYQGSKSGGAQPAPAPSPRGGGTLPKQTRAPSPEPASPAGERPGGEFGELLDAMTRGNATRPHSPDGGGRGGEAGGGGLGPLGDILGDILGGGSRGGRGGGQGGGLGPLGDILGDILGGGRPAPRAASGSAGANPLGDMLGGLLAGGAAGGGLGALLEQFEQAGKGDAARSWVSRGDNIPLTPKDIESTFGSGIIEMIAEKFGMPKNELLKGLSEAMPEVIDRLTPDGRLPERDEIARRI